MPKYSAHFINFCILRYLQYVSMCHSVLITLHKLGHSFSENNALISNFVNYGSTQFDFRKKTKIFQILTDLPNLGINVHLKDRNLSIVTIGSISRNSIT